MKKTITRAVAAGALASLALVGTAAPALASDISAQDDRGGVIVVDEPDTSELNNIWTFAPLGVPVFGLIQSVAQVPGKLLPSA
ncbi:hypothetical protein [Amycolatopsis nigrescens]|uniref:hypothetical protein n=1 Tax=Amycolatopsis nigrescens TaxID=381445 RepID=UPI000362EE33|nr:hypothetical protein [Amycolatopsis nigrescens]